MAGPAKSTTRFKAWVAVCALSLLVALLTAGGCAARMSQKKPQSPPDAAAADKSKQGTAARTITLFFADRQAMHVVPEERQINPNGRPLAQVLIQELIKGPDDPFLVGTMPKGTRLLSVSVRNRLATVDFSKEIRDNHPGGSAGEAMTLNSLVFTLTELPDVDRVRILIEGKTAETLTGHADLTRPLDRGPVRESPVFLDRERQAWLQGLVDAGRDPWRRDPLEVARREGRMASLRLSDAFRLKEVKAAPAGPDVRPGAQRAVVEVTHAGKVYDLTLIQPVRTGRRGIWAIEAVTPRS